MNITENVQVEDRPFAARLVFHISGICELLHIIILEPSLSFVPHILRDFVDFLEQLDATCTEETLLI